MSATTPIERLLLRPLAWTDLATLARLETELFATDAWSEATWWAELAGRPRRRYLVAEAPDGELAGYAGLDLAGDTADVMTLAVNAAYRGIGLGHRLLEGLLADAAAAGVAAVLLEVRADNAPALALYAAHGFRQLAVRPRYYQPGDVDALVLRRLMDRPVDRPLEGWDRGA